MKHFSKILLVLFLFSTSTSFAQTFKFGHINSQDLINLMSERDSAVVKLDKYSKDLQATMEGFQTEYMTKAQVYQQKQATWTAAVLESKQRELQEIQSRLENFQQSASQEYRQMEQLFYAPVIQKANEVINKIGKDKGFTYIFDTSTGVVPFINTAQSEDIMSLAKTALNIPADKKPFQLPAPAEEAQAAAPKAAAPKAK